MNSFKINTIHDFRDSRNRPVQPITVACDSLSRRRNSKTLQPQIACDKHRIRSIQSNPISHRIHLFGDVVVALDLFQVIKVVFNCVDKNRFRFIVCDKSVVRIALTIKIVFYINRCTEYFYHNIVINILEKIYPELLQSLLKSIVNQCHYIYSNHSICSN